MDEEQRSSQMIADASQQVSAPAIGLLITGIIGAFFSLLTLVSLGIGLGFSTLWMERIPRHFEDFYQGVFGFGSSFVGILVAVFVIYAAIKMRELTQWSLAVVASILAMIPCISPCCIIGLPVGIWCLIVLMRPDIKAAFH